jgi:hypothetical protein
MKVSHVLVSAVQNSYHVYTTLSYANDNVRWVPCHHGVARPQVADGGDGFQIWRIAANILNK